ncbi:hypothetical protein AGMMS49991_07910 [Spirochaetia bacterium]|nr:hypothetical protein AGMMS49991_07910 [Spirochaetia bacterium]
MNKRFVFCVLLAALSMAAFAQEEASEKNVVMTADLFFSYGWGSTNGLVNPYNEFGGGFAFGIPDKGAIGWTLGMTFWGISDPYNGYSDDVGFKWSTETTFYKRLSVFDLGLEGAFEWDFRYAGEDPNGTLRFTLAPMAAINVGVFRLQAAYRIDMRELAYGRFHSEVVATVGLRFGLDPVESLILAWLLSAWGGHGHHHRWR